MAYLTVVSTTKTSITIRASATISGMSDTLRYKTYLNFMKNGSWVGRGQIDHGTVAPGGSFNNSKKFSGSIFTPGTTYTIEGILLYSWDNGNTWNEGSTTATVTATTASDTPQPPQPDEDPDGVWRNISVSPNGKTLSFSGQFKQTSDTNTGWQFLVRLDNRTSGTQLYSGTATLNQNGTKSVSGTTNQLSIGSHTIYFIAQAQGISDIYDYETAIIEQQQDQGNYRIQLISVTPTVDGATISINFFTDMTGSNYSYIKMFSYSLNQDMSGATNMPSATGSVNESPESRTWFLDSLNSNTKYYYRIEYVRNDVTPNISVAVYTGYFNTLEQQTVNLLTWSWERTTGSWNALTSGTADATKLYNANDAITNKKATINFSYQVWNDLIHWVRDNLDLLEANYSSSDVSDAEMTSDSKIFTAKRWNSFASLCNSLLPKLGAPASIRQQSKGDVVYGSIFTNTITLINERINLHNS